MTGDIASWAKELESPDVERRRHAAAKLSACGTDARSAAPALVRCASDPDDVVRESAVAALEDLGEPEESALASLLDSSNSANADVAYWAVTLIGRLGNRGAAAVPQLSAAVSNHPANSVRERATWALGQIGPPARSAVAVLQAAANSADSRLARLAREALQRINR
jgi:HEAT repeat protein